MVASETILLHVKFFYLSDISFKDCGFVVFFNTMKKLSISQLDDLSLDDLSFVGNIQSII